MPGPTVHSRRGRSAGRGNRERTASDPTRHLPSAISQGIRFRPRHRAGAVPGAPRHQPCLRLALSEGAAGQHARLRHRRPRRAQPRTGRWRRVRPYGRGVRRARAEADPGFRAEPHGGRRRRQPALARRAGMGAGLDPRRLVRHRLGPGQPLSDRQAAGAVPRRAVRRGAGIRRSGPTARTSCRSARCTTPASSATPIPRWSASATGLPACCRSGGRNWGGAAAN
jgi:hypothetical protein